MTDFPNTLTLPGKCFGFKPPFLGFGVILKNLLNNYMAIKNSIFLEGHSRPTPAGQGSFILQCICSGSQSYFGSPYSLAELAIL